MFGPRNEHVGTLNEKTYTEDATPEKPERDFSNVLANGNGGGWAALGMEATIW